MSADDALRELGSHIASALGPWFLASQRDLIWRTTRDPYAIWVSEIMLQQTRVETVERYYPAFVERFPTVSALAAADEDAVLEAWSGLGYYRRARLLHRGAQMVVGELDGIIPAEVERLREIPGIGAYTAGAIASIAFDRPQALVDGNVARVFSRLRGVREPKRQGADAKEHWKLAQHVVEHGQPRILAQALMELGALVCTPKGARCDDCPLRVRCHALADGAVAEIPAVRRKTAQPKERFAAVALFHRQQLYVERRPAKGLLAGMWSLPLLPLGERGPEPGVFEAAFGMPAPRWTAAGEVIRHVFTHRIWELQVFRGGARRRPRPAGEGRWIAIGERPAGGVPSVTEKTLLQLGW